MGVDDKIDKGLVLVTGSTGYVAGHVIKQLMELGYRVRGTVRQSGKAEHLYDMIDEKLPLELKLADLLREEHWDKAVEGCKYVLHIASPDDLSVTEEEAEEKLFKPARDGVRNVFKAALKSGTVKRIVMTSSAGAVAHRQLQAKLAAEGKALDASYKASTCPKENPVPYLRSKIMAEDEAWRLIADKEENPNGVELVTMCPGVIFGPPVGASENESIRLIKSHFAPNDFLQPEILIAACDVEDVAAAHIRAMEREEAKGQRFLLAQQVTDSAVVVDMIADKYNPLGFKVCNVRMPTSLAKDLASNPNYPGHMFLQGSLPILSIKLAYDVSPAEKILDWKRKSVREAVESMVERMIDLGHIKDKPQEYEKWLENRSAHRTRACFLHPHV